MRGRRGIAQGYGSEMRGIVLVWLRFRFASVGIRFIVRDSAASAFSWPLEFVQLDGNAIDATTPGTRQNRFQGSILFFDGIF
jgi:hypothetical protein